MAEESVQATRFGERHFFLIRRLHSLSGLVPVGAYLVIHLLTNAAVLVPGTSFAYQIQVERIHSLGPLLVPIEITFIFIPILFHALVGLAIALEAIPNAGAYRYGPNIRYTLQRITGYIAFAFILYHVWHLHWVGRPLGGGHFAVHDETGAPAAAVTTARAIQASWWIAPWYAVGILSSVYHLSDGLWTSLITWGITIRPRTQRISAYACAVFGVVLGLVGLGALSGFQRFRTEGVTTPLTMQAPANNAASSALSP